MATKRKLKGQRRATVLAVAAYYYRNRARMRYDSYLRDGYPIASGSVEGACKNLVKDRMERSGMRWTLPMAEAVLRLRAVYLSEHFEQYWPFHVDQDQKRLFQSVKRSEEHTSELQSRSDLVCRLLLEKKNKKNKKV